MLPGQSSWALLAVRLRTHNQAWTDYNVTILGLTLSQQREQARVAEAARRARLVATARFTTQSVDPFDVLSLDPVKARGWDKGRQLSEKQRSLLTKQGINPDSIPFSQARQLIAEIFRRWDGKLCSFKQAKILRKYGYQADVSFAEASATIDALAKNNWRKPVEVAA